MAGETQIMGRPITMDGVLKFFGASALCVTGWLLSGAWGRIEKMEQRQNDFDGRAIRMEERQVELRRTLDEMRSDIKDIKRMSERDTASKGDVKWIGEN